MQEKSQRTKYVIKIWKIIDFVTLHTKTADYEKLNAQFQMGNWDRSVGGKTKENSGKISKIQKKNITSESMYKKNVQNVLILLLIVYYNFIINLKYF